MLTTRTREGGATDMHVYMLQQLAADRVAELRADARRARHQRVLRASKADRARAGPDQSTSPPPCDTTPATPPGRSSPLGILPG